MHLCSGCCIFWRVPSDCMKEVGCRYFWRWKLVKSFEVHKSLGRNMYVHTVQSEKKTKLDTGPRVSQNHGDKTDIKTCCGLPVKHTNLHFFNEWSSFWDAHLMFTCNLMQRVFALRARRLRKADEAVREQSGNPSVARPRTGCYETGFNWARDHISQSFLMILILDVRYAVSCLVEFHNITVAGCPHVTYPLRSLYLQIGHEWSHGAAAKWFGSNHECPASGGTLTVPRKRGW